MLVEKPATLNLDNLSELIKLSRSKGLLMDVIFHWNYGNEVLYLRDKIKSLPAIEKIKTFVFDPYFADNRIKPDKVSLGGTWLDCVINALSMIS